MKNYLKQIKSEFEIINDNIDPTKIELLGGLQCMEACGEFCKDKELITLSIAVEYFYPGSNIFPKIDFEYVLIEVNEFLYYIRRATIENMALIFSPDFLYKFYPLFHVESILRWLRKEYEMDWIIGGSPSSRYTFNLITKSRKAGNSNNINKLGYGDTVWEAKVNSISKVLEKIHVTS